MRIEEVKVTWTEEWRRISVARVDMDDVQDWMQSDESITTEVVREYLLAENPAENTHGTQTRSRQIATNFWTLTSKKSSSPRD